MRPTHRRAGCAKTGHPGWHGFRFSLLDLPEEFDLEIEGRDRLRHVCIRWRSLSEIGVSFV